MKYYNILTFTFPSAERLKQEFERHRSLVEQINADGFDVIDFGDKTGIAFARYNESIDRDRGVVITNEIVASLVDDEIIDQVTVQSYAGTTLWRM